MEASKPRLIEEVSGIVELSFGVTDKYMAQQLKPCSLFLKLVGDEYIYILPSISAVRVDRGERVHIYNAEHRVGRQYQIGKLEVLDEKGEVLFSCSPSDRDVPSWAQPH